MRPRTKPVEPQSTDTIDDAGAAVLWRSIAVAGYRLDPASMDPDISRRHLDRQAAIRLRRVVNAATAGRPFGEYALVPGWRETLADAGIVVAP